MSRKKKTRRGRVLGSVLVVAGLLLILGLCGAAARLAPYARLRMDMSLLQSVEEARPSTLLVYPPETRSQRCGVLQSPSQLVIAKETVTHTALVEMPPELYRAFVAVEDKRFYRHRGVDIPRTTRAVWEYLWGEPTCGGSSITQQLVKNLTGRCERTPRRKLTEIFTALDLERRLDKEGILEAYLHVINLGQGCFGVDAAAQTYFQKQVRELSLAECATLAAITNNPTVYDPLKQPSACKARRDLVLTLMETQGYISRDERDEAIQAPLGLNPVADPTEPLVTSWYADLVVSDVISDLMKKRDYTYAAASRLLYNGGLRIETVMDVSLQELLEQYFADQTHFPEGEKGRPQASFILVDPQNGDILAVAGAIGEKTASRIQNYATDTRRPAGSCIKPLSVYAPALERGLVTWADVLLDEPFERGKWPANADGFYRGEVTVGRSVIHSLNPPAVRLVELVGLTEAFGFARDRMGLHGLISPQEGKDHDCTLSSLALGQQSHGLTSRELTAAYTALYHGVRYEPISYTRVWSREGELLLENTFYGEEVLSPETAAILTRLLMGVNSEGTAASYLRRMPRLGVETAGKTGTTQGNCDRRYIGMTPRLLAGVWMGYDYPTELKGIKGNPCVSIWDEVMEACETVYRGAPSTKHFPLPTELCPVEFCPLSGKRPSPYCNLPKEGRHTEWGWFRRGSEPQGTCPLHAEPPFVPPFEEDPSSYSIPPFSGDVLPRPPASQTPPASEEEKDGRSWFSRWFRRYAR